MHIPFDDKTFRYWNVKTGRWEVEEGEYLIMVGVRGRYPSVRKAMDSGNHK